MKMKVYVCECEENAERRPVAVMSSLDAALEMMRTEYSEYMRECRQYHPEVDWYSGGSTGQWGWYDTNVPEGFYVTEMELDK